MNAPTQSGNLRNGTRDLGWTQSLPATILLVEDEPAVRAVTRQALELAGYRVLEADGPSSAFQLIDESSSIDLLLTDIVMPDMNGAELARRIRRRRPGLATLFMSGYAESEALRLATLEVGQKHIQKPFSISHLLTRVAEVLATRWKSGDDGQSPQFPSP